MIATLQTVQILSGIAWLFPAALLSPRIVAVWRPTATRTELLSAPIGFIAWLMVGFSVRWIIWPQALGAMGTAELTTWAALYAMSASLAVWVFIGARQTKGE